MKIENIIGRVFFLLIRSDIFRLSSSAQTSN